jgi:YidC/Oxa1 family membrane protein insertase
MDKRTLLAVVLSIAVIFTYQTFFVKPPVKTQQAAPVKQDAAVTPQAATSATTAAEKTTPPSAILTQQTTGRMIGAQAAAGTERDIIVETSLYRAVFTTRGAALKSFQLKQYKTALENTDDLVDIFYRLIGKGTPKPEGQSKLVELVHVKEGMPRPLAVSFPDSTVNIPGDGFYEADGSTLDMTRGTDPRKLTFTQTYQGELRIDKIFTFHPDKYSFELEVRVHNLAGYPLNQNGGLAWYQYVDPAAPVLYRQDHRPA